MAWFRAMGAAEVAYHEATVVGRGDDHPGRALAYYGSRGETPLRWAGAGAARLGLEGEVTPDSYAAAFGPGGFRMPGTGERLVRSTRPGFELVVGAHKSVAVLGVVGEADAMHSILDVETAATMAWLDGWFQQRGGRRGRAQARTATGGLAYAVTRHGTSRAGDPSPHDHVLVANVVAMLDEPGGRKGLDSAALRDTVEAATMVGRLHSAARAVELGFQIEADDGPTGRLRHWRIVGVPDEVCRLFSKRSDEIAEYLETHGQRGFRAAGIAARASRALKRHTGVDELLPAWHAELEAAGWPLERLAAHLAAHRDTTRALPFPMADREVDELVGDVLAVDGPLLANHKVFTRSHLTAEIAPRLYGRDPAELDRVLSRLTASREVVPLIRVAGAREQTYTTAAVLMAERTIAHAIGQLAGQSGPVVDAENLTAAVSAKEQALGRPLTPGQRRAVEAVCSGQGVTVVLGVAGAGKTTALDAAATALEHAGYRVVATSTSGQAARTLGAETGIESRTLASLLGRFERGQDQLDSRTVVIVDEASMVADADLARLTLAIQRAGAALVLVGDDHQLGAVGPGGALTAVLERHPHVVVTLDDNVRQHDAGERRALARLRDGDIGAAIGWYRHVGRIHIAPTRTDTLVAAVDAWAADVAAGHDTALLAWRRADVADLNRLARRRWDQLGHLHGPDITVEGGRTYARGDRTVTLAPDRTARTVTSEQLTITAVRARRVDAVADDGRPVVLTGEAIDSEHLDHAYARTVHRAQGATVDRAHVIAAGGGRELAYVAMSRSRDVTIVHAAADTVDQAVEDLERDWSTDRQQRWLIDTPAIPGLEPEPVLSVSERLVTELRRAVATPAPITLQSAYARLATVRQDLADLHTGRGRWHDTSAGDAARRLDHARHQLEVARGRLTSGNLRRWDRRAAAHAVEQYQHAVTAAEERWSRLGEPEVAQLESSIEVADADVTRARLHDLSRRLAGHHQHDRVQDQSVAGKLAERGLGRDEGIDLGR